MLSKPVHASLQRRLALWLLVLTTVFGALAPTLSHALVWARGGAAPLLEVCTSTGVTWVANTASPDSSDEQEAVPSLKSCPFCLLASDRAVPPTHPLVHLFVVSGEHDAPTARQAFYFPEPIALTPPSRGPPASL
jgi:hypothetical protein